MKNILIKVAALYLLIIIISSSFVYGIEEENDPEMVIEEIPQEEEVYIEPIPPADTNFEEYNLNYLRLNEDGSPKLYSESAILMEASTGNILEILINHKTYIENDEDIIIEGKDNFVYQITTTENERMFLEDRSDNNNKSYIVL